MLKLILFFRHFENISCVRSSVNPRFGLKKFAFLGHVISKVGISVDPVRIEIVIKWERLKNLIEIRSSGLSWVLKVVC